MGKPRKGKFYFDNLISQGKANEGIIVMCNGMLTFEKKNEIFLNITEAFEKMLTTEVIPYIEQKYRTYGDKSIERWQDYLWKYANIGCHIKTSGIV